MRVLLVEDDSRIAGFVARGLRENSYAVDVASDGDEAIYMASINSYDVFILDVNLPKKDGFEVCGELRELGNTKPILMLTARDANEDLIRGLDLVLGPLRGIPGIPAEDGAGLPVVGVQHAGSRRQGVGGLLGGLVLGGHVRILRSWGRRGSSWTR